MAARPALSSAPPPVQAPRWDKDPAASLGIFPVVLNVAGEDVEVPAMPAADWLSVLMRSDLVLDDLLDLIPNVEQVMARTNLDVEGWTEVCLDMVTVASARSWWIALRLIHVAVNSWDALGGTMVRYVKAEEVSLAAWLTLFTSTLINAMDPKDVTMALARIEAPPPEARREPEIPEMTASQWLALGR